MKRTAKEYFDMACQTFGLENKHTIGIGQLLECQEEGYLDQDLADFFAEVVYDHGIDEMADEAFAESYDDYDESGFDPYAGCYTGDC